MLFTHSPTVVRGHPPDAARNNRTHLSRRGRGVRAHHSGDRPAERTRRPAGRGRKGTPSPLPLSPATAGARDGDLSRPRGTNPLAPQSGERVASAASRVRGQNAGPDLAPRTSGESHPLTLPLSPATAGARDTTPPLAIPSPRAHRGVSPPHPCPSPPLPRGRGIEMRRSRGGEGKNLTARNPLAPRSAGRGWRAQRAG